MTLNRTNSTFSPVYLPEHEELESALQTWLRIRKPLLATGGSLALLAGVIGCILGLLVIYRNRDKKRFGFLGITGSLLVSCLMYKCLSVLFILPVWLHDSRWLYGQVFCKIFMFSNHINRYSILYHIVLLMIYVVICIRRPTTASKMDQPKVIGIILGVIWLAMFLFNVEYLVAYETHRHGPEREHCYQVRGHIGHMTVAIMEFVFLLLIPVPTMIITSIVICVSARKRRNNRYINMADEEERHLQDFVRTSVALIVLILSIIIPGIIYQFVLMSTFSTTLIILQNLHMFFFQFFPAFIPFILLFFVKDFRFTLCQMFGLKCYGQNNETQIADEQT